MSREQDGLALVAALRRGQPVAELRERAGAAEPVGLGEIHPSWLGEAIPEQASGLVREHLVRRRLAHLVDMPAGLPPAEELERRLVDLGIRRLAASLALVPPLARAQVAQGLGPHADALVAALAQPAAPGDASLAVREVAGLPRAQLLVGAAARHLAPALDATRTRQLAQRLPRPLGELVLEQQGKGVAPPEVSRAALAAIGAAAP